MENYYTMIGVDNYYYDKQHLDAIGQLKNRNINAYILDTGEYALIKIPESEVPKLPIDQKYNDFYLPTTDISGRSLYTDKEFDSIEEGWISINDYVEVMQ